MSDVLKDAADGHQVVSHTGWVNARKALLAKEKAFTRLRDELTRERAALPWELVDRSYVFEGASGPRALGDLFEGRSQLIAYHFMFHPEWPVGCPHCSRVADSFNGIIAHLNHRDSTMVAISRAPYPKLAAYHVRMGWTFPWLSSFGNDFNRDYGVSFTPDEIAAKTAHYNYADQNPDAPEREGVSVFYRDRAGRVFHTYSAYARGIESLMVDYAYLDLVPKGRDEAGRGLFWVRRRDEYA